MELGGTFPNTEDERQRVWSAAKEPLWQEYGEGQRCPSFVPGLMVLHAVLSLTGDARSARTRYQIDQLVGADAAWTLLARYMTGMGRPDLYERREYLERLQSP